MEVNLKKFSSKALSASCYLSAVLHRHVLNSNLVILYSTLAAFFKLMYKISDVVLLVKLTGPVKETGPER